MNKTAYKNEETYDIVAMAVSYIRLATNKNIALVDYLSRSENGDIEWKDFDKFCSDILSAFREMSVPDCEDAWDFIGDYMYGYSWSDEILHVDIVERYLNGELEDANDIQWVECGFKSREEMKEWIAIEESKFFQFALYDFFVRTNHR